MADDSEGAAVFDMLDGVFLVDNDVVDHAVCFCEDNFDDGFDNDCGANFVSKDFDREDAALTGV